MYCTYVHICSYTFVSEALHGGEGSSCLAVVLAVDQQLHSKSCDCCLLRLSLSELASDGLRATVVSLVLLVQRTSASESEHRITAENL